MAEVYNVYDVHYGVFWLRSQTGYTAVQGTRPVHEGEIRMLFTFKLKQ